jgi:mannose-6-phosphate isomerase
VIHDIIERARRSSARHDLGWGGLSGANDVAEEVTEVASWIADSSRKAPPVSEVHEVEERPWGSFEVLSDAEAHSKVKYLTVHPGRRLSYQSHEYRAEHWIVVQGLAEVLLDGVTYTLAVGESIDVPRKARHRCANPGKVDLIFVEVQQGDYFGEDDIVRYEDDFGRLG